jgi:4-carboxymuconolactone decarboxylase
MLPPNFRCESPVREGCTVDDAELRRVTRETAEMLFGPPKPGEGVFQLWKKFDPDLARHISTFFTGRLYARNVISQKERELCAVAALTVLQRLDELRIHIGAALNVGATREEVAEVIFQMMTYGGVPTMVEGLKVCKAVLQERGMWDDD